MKQKSIKVSFESTKSKREFLPPVRTTKEAKKQLIGEATSEGLKLTQYLRSCINVGRRAKGYGAKA